MTAKTRTILWITLSAALIVAGITAAWAQTQTWRGVHAPFWFHHGPMGYIAGELELNDNQKAQIRTIWEGERPNIAGLVHEFASEQREMDAMRSKGEPADDATIQESRRARGRRWPGCLRRKRRSRERFTTRFWIRRNARKRMNC